MTNDEHQSSLFGDLEEFAPASHPTHARPKASSHMQGSAASADIPISARPLADRMRPRTLDEIVGQAHLLAHGKALRRSIESDHVPSMILWGPPGSGKTTLASVIALSTQARFVPLSAVTAGVADLRRVVEDAAKLLRATERRTILFIDEIHRFNKAQQDAILPHVERGAVTLIGATTENPSFEVNAALLSRSRVYTLHALTDVDILDLLRRALTDNERGLGAEHLTVTDDALAYLAGFANGDARAALNALELAASVAPADATGVRAFDLAAVEDAVQRRALLYDKGGEEHYNIISALHKSLRGSDPDAALYWLARMLESGEDPLYVVRRLIRFASEDIGMADPQALLVCVAAQQAVHFIGMPEGALALAQAVVHLATAPKSNALYTAYAAVVEDVRATRNDPVPLQLRNAPTRLMKDLDYGKGYKYAHDDYAGQPDPADPSRPPPERPQDYLPEQLRERAYYHPGAQGNEASIQAWLARRRRQHTPDPETP
ncbi:MAG: Replication-associated recombination protein RarA [Ktedonobacterales bacterium]|jgi:putative ATPase|nr:MAG: Replication-associated recombination protein RarA [Ktedonobacterales bacterium]